MSDEHENGKAGPPADDAKRDENAAADAPAEPADRPDAATVPATDAPGTQAPGTGETAEDEPAAAPAEDEPAGEEAPQDEIAELKDKLLRTLAENENMRRRARREREDTAKYAVAGFARDLLSVADNLGRALAALPDGEEEDDNGFGGFIEGVRLTERELASVFERHGIEKIEPLGEKFDPNLHEAMFEIPSGDAAPGTVVQIVEIGYVLKERLLRAAKVGIARALPDAEKGEHVDTTA